MDHHLRLNDILTVGTHNSYKQAIEPAVMAIVQRAAPATWQGLDYEHPPLVKQLEDGARGLELDIIHDPEGGRYAHPALRKLAGLLEEPAYVAAMSQPGLKVLHIQDVDFRSSCETYVGCLTQIRGWSSAHPDHTPILITMNTNDSKSRAPGGTDGLPFDTVAYDNLDAEILSVFPRSQLIVPVDVRGDYPTLREAVLAKGWPSLGWARGRIWFVVDEETPHIDAYRGGRRSLEGRVCFVNTDEASPAGGYITLNEHSDLARIAAAVDVGYMVRTRADADTREARTNDITRRDAALASGAQYVSTDYRRPETRLSDYHVRLPDEAITVANPRRNPQRCAGIRIE